MNLQRRNILRGSVAAAMALPIAGVKAVELTKDLKWDMETNVVILGYGGAGAVPPSSARCGRKVLILEKLPQGAVTPRFLRAASWFQRTRRRLRIPERHLRLLRQ